MRQASENDYLVPVGYVVPWISESPVPEGWAIANGDNGTSDLSSLPAYFDLLGEAKGFWIQKVE